MAEATTTINNAVQFKKVNSSNWKIEHAEPNVFYRVVTINDMGEETSFDLYLGNQLLSNNDELAALQEKILLADDLEEKVDALIAGLDEDSQGVEDLKALIDYVEANGASLAGLINDVTTAQGDISDLQTAIANVYTKEEAETAFDSKGSAAAVLGTATDDESKATVYGAKAYAKEVALGVGGSALTLSKQYTDLSLTWIDLDTMIPSEPVTSEPEV